MREPNGHPPFRLFLVRLKREDSIFKKKIGSHRGGSKVHLIVNSKDSCREPRKGFSTLDRANTHYSKLWLNMLLPEASSKSLPRRRSPCYTFSSTTHSPPSLSLSLFLSPTNTDTYIFAEPKSQIQRKEREKLILTGKRIEFGKGPDGIQYPLDLQEKKYIKRW